MSFAIALINPPYRPEDVAGGSKSIKRVLNIIPPLGLTYLATVLEREGFEVKVFDFSIGGEEKTLYEGLDKGKYSLVGITSTTPSYYVAENLACKIKKKYPDVYLVIGGAHVSADPQGVMERGVFDIGVLNEGEFTLLELARTLAEKGRRSLHEVKGIVFRDEKGEIQFTPPREYIKNLDALPLPARYLLPPLKVYHPTPASYRRLPLGVMMTSRGCPNRCTFCDRAVFGNRVRFHSPERVVQEFEELVCKYGAREIRFFDDTFTLNKSRVLEICALLQKKGLHRIPWTCLTAVKSVDKEILKAIKDAGCWQVLYGLESGDDRMLKLLKKGNTVQDNTQAVFWAKEVGLSVRADFIIGTPGETKESMEKTLKFAKSLPLDYAHFNKFVPFPGTEIYHNLVKKGYKFNFERSSIVDHTAIIYTPEGITPEEFKNFLNRAYKEFYLRPSYLLKHLLSIRSWEEFKGQFQGFLAIKGL